ncbi:hypothetical protein I307_05559 [Cryptococcus deuterogattii 99/473]|uniref:Unplaced genomic scaffold supercont1.15, whole genome shotgun sequence n=1 Tax=Cryptococcus deuterogattii Ram5 TaxID=1296110 RepID=A0A0D0UTJ1_9TREE|nr:hypothetical protein I309_03705 [Cryptococcus deuterogattii LA55]KIR38526.1 hypothetical protein I313_05638 [Cryptococcus deuterogattii Ram5]KIR90281.1 hypothetical protein I304_05857 [Cryptococcus deuterogattii CBS 10090]KIR96969.1 hypothetical protein L804_05627 [Cryptococcus deuterogattii 2001/935-1]KIY55146.1 hypothetical protein I307_05559 [Cryptococcus deuterogattii 99/473]
MAPITPAMKRFLSAEQYAVIGKVLSDRSRWDNKVLRWYQIHKYPVIPVRPDNPSSEPIEGSDVLSDPLAIPSLPSTSVSIIIHPSKSLGILQNLFSNPSQTPYSVWFQPGADDENIWKWVKEKGLEDKVIGRGACVLRDGDSVLSAIQEDKSNL